MHPSAFDLHYHELVFSLRGHERTGAAFQQFFEEIMVRHECTFTPVKTHGNQGDWKNDGWIPGSGTVFQCYSPERTEGVKIVAKIREDFAGALAKWTGKMKAWTFVYSEQAKLPPMVVSLIEDLKMAHPSSDGCRRGNLTIPAFFGPPWGLYPTILNSVIFSSHNPAGQAYPH